MTDMIYLRRVVPPLPALVLAWCFVLVPRPGVADGGFLYPDGYTLVEDAQHAFLDYDAETGRERLSILPSFQGDARDFAWVVPVPGRPELEAEDSDLFRALAEMTRPVRHYRDGEWDCLDRRVHSPDVGAVPPVEILDRELVGYYDTMILAATESEALVDTLEGWGFLHEDNLDEATRVFGHYVEQSWYFVTMRVDSTAFDPPGKTPPIRYYYRHLEPIRLTFSAPGPVYPMRISALSAAEDSRVHLYVQGDHRMTFDGAATHYAKRLDADDFRLPHSGWRNVLEDNLDRGRFLTMLRRDFDPELMDRDILLERTPTDEEFRLVIVGGFPWTGLLVVSVPVGIAVRRRFWRGG